MTLSQLAQQLYDVLVSAYALTPEEATECVRTAELLLAERRIHSPAATQTRHNPAGGDV